MKRGSSILLVLALLIILAGNSGATSYSFQPVPADLYDLDHYKYYTWGLTPNPAIDGNITEASLFFNDIRNWDNQPNVLYVNLLPSAALGVAVGTDNQGGGNHFSGLGFLLEQYQNLPTTPQDLTYSFDSSELNLLSSYLADGNFGLGFDPDCHFYNNGITLTIETTPVPEPTSMLLLGSGLLGLAGYGRKRLRQKN